MKTNDVRTGLKKPEQETKKRAASAEAAQPAGALDTADPASSDRHAGTTQTAASSAAAAGSDDVGGAGGSAPSEWDIARAARDR